MKSRFMTEDDPFGQKLANKIHREIGEKLAEVNPYEIRSTTPSLPSWLTHDTPRIFT